jgi:hypothetical protein
VPRLPGFAVHNNRSGPALETGAVLIVTVETAVEVQPRLVPVTVYVVVDAGEAVAVVAPVGVAPPDHVYVVAPLAVMVAVAPAQTEGDVTAVTGSGFTVTVETAVPVQVPVAPVTV